MALTMTPHPGQSLTPTLALTPHLNPKPNPSLQP